MCTLYVSTGKGFSIPGNCEDLESSPATLNPTVLIKELKDRLNPPFEFQHHNFGGLLLTTNAQLNSIYLRYHHDPGFTLSTEDRAFLISLQKKPFEHQKDDVYKTSVYLVSKQILENRDSRIQSARIKCKASGSQNCPATSAWTNYLKDLTESVLKDDNSAFLGVIDRVITDMGDESPTAVFAFGVLKGSFLDSKGFLTSLPFVKELSFPSFFPEFSKDSVKYDFDQAKIVSIINTALLFKSQILKRCYQTNCFFNGTVQIEQLGMYEVWDQIKSYEELIFLALGHLKFSGTTKISREEIEQLVGTIQHFENFDHLIASITTSIDDNKRFLKVIKRRNQHLKPAISFLAQRLTFFKFQELKSLKGLMKVKTIEAAYADYMTKKLVSQKPTWWTKTSPMLEALSLYSNLNYLGDFIDFKRSLYKTQTGLDIPRELVASVEESVGPWNPEFLSTVRDPSVISILNSHKVRFSDSRSFIHGYMMDLDSEETSKGFVKKLLEIK